jgi:hypothetical protein
MSTAGIGESRLLSGGSNRGARTPDVRTPESPLANDIVKRQKRLEQARMDQDNIWDDIDLWVTSRRGHYNIGYKKGMSAKDEGGTNIYDNTASLDLQTFADGFQAQTASPVLDWWAGRFMDPLRKDSQAMKWIDDVKEAMNYELARSNFYEEYNESVQDASSHGIATMIGPEWNYKKGVLEYRSFHPREIFCQFDMMGNPILWHDKFPITARQIIKEFPDSELPEELQKRIDDNPFREFMCIHAVYERNERDIKSPAATDMPWASVWVLESEKTVLLESGYKVNPFDSWIWRKGGPNLYCTSPAIDAVYDVMMENQAAKALIKSVQLSVEPPLIITKGVKGNVNFFPLGQTILDNPADRVQAFQFPTNFNIGVQQINDMREQLTKKFRADIFNLLSSLPQQMTAFQASAIQGEKISLLIPIVTRSSSQLLIPKLNKTFHELAQAQRLPPPPQSIIQNAETPVNLDLIGPVSTAAKRFLSQQGFNAMMAQLQEVRQVLPDNQYEQVVEGYDSDQMRKFLIESNSAPQKLQLDDDKLQMVRQAKAQAAQKAQDMQQLQSLTDAYKKTSDVPQQGGK